MPPQNQKLVLDITLDLLQVTLEALLLSRGLAYRMNLIKAELAEKSLAEERLRREQEEERRIFLEEQKVALEQKVAERTAELSAERERSEALLRNILPDSIAVSRPSRRDESKLQDRRPQSCRR